MLICRSITVKANAKQSGKKWKSKIYDKQYGDSEVALEEAAKLVAIKVRTSLSVTIDG